MNYQTLSPTGCAGEVLAEIQKFCPHSEAHKLEIERLIRQCIRLYIEHCAMVAEDYVATEDLDGKLTGIEVGDRIAEELRKLADERTAGRKSATSMSLLTHARIAPLD